MNYRKLISKYEPQLTALLAAVRRAEEFLGPDDDWVEDDRRILYEAIERHTGYNAVYHVGHADYVTTAHASVDTIDRVLHKEGYDRNLISGRKYRTHHDGGRQYAHASWALDDGDHQHHIYTFAAPNGGTDIYAHYEDSVLDPEAHLHIEDDDDDIKGMRRGDPRGLFDILDRWGVEYGDREL